MAFGLYLVQMDEPLFVYKRTMLTVILSLPSTDTCKHRTQVSNLSTITLSYPMHEPSCLIYVEKQIEGGKEFLSSIEGLVQLFERAEKESDSQIGLWQTTDRLSLADVVAGPCASLRFRSFVRVFKKTERTRKGSSAQRTPWNTTADSPCPREKNSGFIWIDWSITRHSREHVVPRSYIWRVMKGAEGCSLREYLLISFAWSYD